jgi:predicted TIM-barrel fold metal-dependent hydrolase
MLAAQTTTTSSTSSTKPGTERIVDVHCHYDHKVPNYIDEFLKVSDRLNLTACMLTPFEHRKIVAEAAKKHPTQIIPFGFVDVDAPDVVHQVEELHSTGFRGLGELENPKRNFNDRAYDPIYEHASDYSWILMFHTGIVMREEFKLSEDVTSSRMRPFHLEEIARRFPKLIVLGAHCGNPEYEWAAEVSRWNPNVFFDLSGSTLQKMRPRLHHFSEIFWWSGVGQDTATPDNDPSAFIKLVFGSDTYLGRIETVVNMYRAVFDACDVPESTRKMILGETMSQFLGLPA